MTWTTLASRIDSRLAEAFASLSLPVELARSLPSARPDLADRQCNAAIGLAKTLGRNPFDIAGEIAAVLSEHREFVEVTVAKPGFVNMRLSDDFIAEMAQIQAAAPDLGIAKTPTPERILIDFGGPNVAKPLHVGHLRSLVIGESLRRILFCTFSTFSGTMPDSQASSRLCRSPSAASETFGAPTLSMAQ